MYLVMVLHVMSPEELEIPKEQETTAAAKELSKDIVFGMISNSRRRKVLRFLQQQVKPGDSVSVRTLSEHIATEENDVPAEQVTYKQRKRVHTSLYQTHLPALAKNGVIEYDKRAGTVSAAPGFRQVDLYLGSSVAPSISFWQRYWLAVGVGSVIFTAILWSQVIPIPSGSTALLGFLLSLIILFSAVLFSVSNR